MGKERKAPWTKGLEDPDFADRGRKKEKGISKLVKKRIARAKKEGLVFNPVLTVKPEPILEPEIKIETPETKSNPKPEAEIKQGQKSKPEREKEIKEEEFKEGLKQIKTREELLAYLESLGNTAVRSEKEGSIFFPAYISEIRKSLESKCELDWRTMREKIREITGDKKTEEKKKLSFEDFKEKYEDILAVNLFDEKREKWIYIQDYDEKKGAWVRLGEGAKYLKPKHIPLDELDALLQEYKNKEEKIKNLDEENQKKIEKFFGKENPSELEADIFEASLKTNGSKKFYSLSSTPDDAKKEAINSKNLKNIADKENKIQGGKEKVEPVKIAEKDKKDKDKEIQELWKIIAQKEQERDGKRMKYAAEEYRTYNMVSSIKKFLGIKYDSAKIDSLHSNYNDYKIANTELLDLKLEYLKKKGLSGEELKKEMGNLVKEFNVDEGVNLIGDHTKAKARVIEEKFGRAPGWITDKASEFINWHRKIGWKKKMIFNTALAMSGIGAVALGANRIISGTAAGAGIAGMMEAGHRGKEKRKAGEKSAELLQSMEIAEDKYLFLMEKMQVEIGGYDKKLKTEKAKARNRKLIGAAAAVFIGSGAFSYILGKTGATHWIMEKLGFETHPTHPISGITDKELSWRQGSPSGLAYNAQEGLPPGGGAAAEHIVPPGKTIDLSNIQEGGNIEASIRDYFKTNPDLIDKYNEQLGGGRKFNAGQIAHRLFSEYGDSRDLVHAGAQVHLSADGMRIESVTGDEHMGYLPEKEPVLPYPEDGASHAGEISEATGHIAPETPGQAPENFHNPADSYFGRNVSHVLDDLDGRINENTREIFHAETHSSEEIAAFKENIADLGYSRGFMENFRDSVFNGHAEEAARSFRSAISLDEKWDNIKGMNFREAAKNMNWRASDKLDTIFKCLKKIIGNEVKPGSGETLEKWTERVSKLAIEKAK